MLQSRNEIAAGRWDIETVTSDQFQFFEVVLKKRRRKWLWRVSTTDGDAVIMGSESSRPAAKYHANRALFLLLLSAPYRSIRTFWSSSESRQLGKIWLSYCLTGRLSATRSSAKRTAGSPRAGRLALAGAAFVGSALVSAMPKPEIALSLYCRLTILPDATRAIRL